MSTYIASVRVSTITVNIINKYCYYYFKDLEIDKQDLINF